MKDIKSALRSKTGPGPIARFVERHIVADDPAPELSRLDRLDLPIRLRGGAVVIPAEMAENVRVTNRRVDAILGDAS